MAKQMYRVRLELKNGNKFSYIVTEYWFGRGNLWITMDPAKYDISCLRFPIPDIVDLDIQKYFN